MKTYNASLAQYRLATKDKLGNVIAFGPLMPRNVAEAKRKAIASCTSFPVYMLNVNAL